MLAGEEVLPEGEAGQEHVGHELGVDLPVLAVLLSAAHFVSGLSVDNHAGEEGHVEVRQRRGEAARQTPGGSHDDVAGVLQLAAEGVPAAHQQVALRSADVGNGLGEDGPGHLREDIRTAHADLAGGLLAVRRVKHVVA